MLTHLNLTVPEAVVAIITPLLPVRKPRHRLVKFLPTVTQQLRGVGRIQTWASGGSPSCPLFGRLFH